MIFHFENKNNFIFQISEWNIATRLLADTKFR